MLRILVLVSFSVLFSSQNAFAVSLFFDDFSSDPALNGWTEISLPPIGSISPLVPQHGGHGNEVIFKKNLNDGIPISLSINREVSTLGFENIQVRLTAHQLPSAALEPEDFLEISVDTNNDGMFESVLKDVEVWDGIQDESTKDSNKSPTFSPKSTAFLPLSSAADNNPIFKIKIEARFEGFGEEYFLTDVEVIGDSIQNNHVIGGNIIEIDNYSLLTTSIGSSPVFAGITGIALAGIGFVIVKRKYIFTT